MHQVIPRLGQVRKTPEQVQDQKGSGVQMTKADNVLSYEQIRPESVIGATLCDKSHMALNQLQLLGIL